MLLVPRHGEELERLAHSLRLAEAPTRRLFDDVAAACARFGLLKRAGKLASFDAWRSSGAWLDAALALMSTELPAWSVRRIVKDDGLWVCSLSRSPNLPIELDDGVEVTHESLPLALLLALVEAKRLAFVRLPARTAAPVADAKPEGLRLCCDNFA